jgi:hypothetical protein
MGPIELIKNGIETHNWGDICSAYGVLTGEKIAPPEHIDICESDLNDLERIINKMRRHKDTKDIETFEKPEVNEDSIVSTETNKNGKHGFSHTVIISEKTLEREKRANETLAKKREKKRRPKPKKYEMVCSDCNKKFKTQIKTGQLGQICSECLKSRSPRR